MTYLLTLLWAVPSGVFWFINAEAMVIWQVRQHPDLAPWSIALATTIGQMVGYALLHLFAGFFLARFGFVRRAVARYRARQAEKGEPRTPDKAGLATCLVFASGGLVGIPPLLALFAIYGSARVGPVQTLVLSAAPARFAWYLGWAYAPEYLRENFGWFAG